MIAISVVICTHNPCKAHLSRVLEALRAQTLPQVRWELIIVDNASNESVTDDCEFRWHPNARLVREEQLGVSFARRRGVLEAGGEVVVFVDDDNVLDSNYLETVASIMTDPSIGALGGGGYPLFESGFVPPPHFYNFSRWLACGAQLGDDKFVGDEIVDLSEFYNFCPFGAGVAVRRKSYLYLVDNLPYFPTLTGRCGNEVLSGDDYEMCHLIALSGNRLVYSSKLRFGHIIPASRTDPQYLYQLTASIGHQRVTYPYAGARRALAQRRSLRYWLELTARLLLADKRRLARIELAILMHCSMIVPKDDRPVFRNVMSCIKHMRGQHTMTLAPGK